MSVRILQGDMREKLAELDTNSVDSIVTDPPYHLTTGKKGGSGPASVNLESPYGRARVGTGFMGMKWDGGDVAMRWETWAELLRVLKPGGYLLAFGGTRTYHRMACAIEDAGFEVRDQIGWAFGSGFPKSHNGPWGGTALKPAWEPICMARKPLIGTVEENWSAHGTGALNIDGCRVGFESEGDREEAFPGGRVTSHASGSLAGPAAAQDVGRTGFREERNTAGRWPANLIHDGSEEVLAAFPDAPGQIADASSSSSRKTQNVYGAMKRGNEASAQRRYAEQGATNFAALPGARRGDGGSAARFFYCPKADRKDRNEGLDGMQERVPHQPSADGRAWDIPGSKSTPRANHHPTVKPTALMRYLCKLVTPTGGLVLDPFMGSGSTGKAAVREGFSFIGIELDEQYIEIARRRIDSDAPLFAEVA